MNNKGSVFTHIVIGILVFAAIISSLLLVPIRYMARIDGEIIKITKNNYFNKSINERLKEEFAENISFVDEYEAKNEEEIRMIKVTTLSEEQETKIVSGNEYVDLEISNETDIEVEISFTKTGIDGHYNPKIYYEGEEMDLGLTRMEGNYSFVIPKEFIYNKLKQEYNYGKYTVELNPINANTSIEASYIDITSRKALIEEEGESTKKTIVTITKGKPNKVDFGNP